MTASNGFYSADDIRSRLGVSTYVIDETIPMNSESLRLIADAGISGVEIIDRREQFLEEDRATMEGIVAGCREVGLRILSFHSRSVQFHTLGVEAEVERCRRMIDHLLDVGGNVWGTHCRIEDPETTEGYARLAEIYEGTDLSLVVENFTQGQTIQAVIDWVDTMNHPRIGMILDVGHERTPEGEDVMTFPGESTRILNAIGPRLRHIHLHDFLDGRDHHRPFTGGLQRVEVFRGLRAIDYAGAFLFEPAPWGETADILQSVGSVPEKIVQMAAAS